jgi:hypothetical protein
MAIRFQSFIVGMAIAAVLFGFAFVVYNAFAGGDDDNNDYLVTLPTRVPTAVAAATQPSRPSGGTVSLTPGVPAILSFTAVPASTQVPSALGDRTSCDQIRGTAYRSNAERNWFNANCLAATPATPASSTAADPARPTSTPVPSIGPGDPFIGALSGLIAEYDAAAVALAAVISPPVVSDAGWRASANAAAQRVQSLGSVAASVLVPSCLSAAQAALTGAIGQLQIAAGLTLTAVSQSDINPFFLVEQRISAGRASLQEATQLVKSAGC